ncbi:MAG: DUF342 domain-containing protein [bacterium]
MDARGQGRTTDGLPKGLTQLLDELDGADLGATSVREHFELAGVRGPAARDGCATITVAEDAMSARATLYPPIGSGEPLEVADVLARLAQLGVAFGVDETAVEAAVWRCNTERTELSNVVVARGRPSVDGTTEHIARIQQGRESEPDTTGDPHGQIDHRAVRGFVVVRSGTPVARVIPASPGAAGMNVRGESIESDTMRVDSPQPGKNVNQQGDTYRATIDGRLEWNTDSFSVNPVLEVRGDVDYHTGHIDFPGDVILHHVVHDGFHVRAEGSVFCHHTLDASVVSCGGDLIAKQGIVGRNGGLLTVGGRVVARHIENCKIRAKGDVLAERGIVSSATKSLGTVRTGPRGVIVGGTLYALHGVVAGQLGTATGPRTLIHTGTDYEAAERLDWLQQKSMEIAMHLERYENRTPAHSDPDAQNLVRRLREAQGRIQSSTEELMRRIDPDDEATISVSGHVYGGVYVEICHVSREIDDDTHAVRFVLNKARGVVEAVPAGGSGRR